MNDTVFAVLQMAIPAIPSILLVYWQINKLRSEVELNASSGEVSAATAAEKISDTAIDWMAIMEKRINELEAAVQSQAATIKEQEEEAQKYYLEIARLKAEIARLVSENTRLAKLVADYEGVIDAQTSRIEEFGERVKTLERNGEHKDDVISQLVNQVRSLGAEPNVS